MQIGPVLRRQGLGYATEGAGYYAWDVEARPLAAWGVALRAAARPEAFGERTTPTDPTDPDRKRSV